MNEPKDKTSISMGLDAIFSANKVDNLLPHDIPTQDFIYQVDLHSIRYSPYQARKFFSEEELNELQQSIKEHGILQPLIARKKSGYIELIAGERRLRAAKMIGLEKVPIVYCDVDDKAAMVFGLVENIQRENLNPIEEAVAFSRFRDEFSMTHDEIAHMIGRSRASITNALRLLLLEPTVRKLLEDGQLEMGHARALLVLDHEKQLDLAFIIVKKQLSVREAERLANTEKTFDGSIEKKKSVHCHEKSEYYSRELSQKFSTKVSVKLNEKGAGRVLIQVDSPSQLDWLMELVK